MTRCREAGVWLHVDAAYAGSAAVCPEFRWCLDGVEYADSIVVNPHKWLFTPMDCSTLWTSRPEALHAAFAAHGDYLAATEGAVDFRSYGPALGRRFRALKLWMVLRWYGREGLQALIREHVRLAALFERWVQAEPGWELSAPRHFSTVCFSHESADNDEIARRATESGQIFVATTKLRGESVIRLAIGNAYTTEDDVRDRLGGAARLRAVIFDLWDTLVEWPVARGGGAQGAARGARRASPTRSSRDRWSRSYRPSADRAARRCLPRARDPGEHLEGEVAARHEFGRRVLRPRRGCRRRARRASRRRDQARGALRLLRGGARGVARDRARRPLRRGDVLVRLRPDEAGAGDLPASPPKRSGSSRPTACSWATGRTTSLPVPSASG